MSRKKKYSAIFEEVIDKVWSKKIIDKLYQSNLSAIQFENVLRRIKDYFMRNKYWKLVKDLDDKEIDEIIRDIQWWMERELACEKSYSEQEKTIWMFNDISSEFKEVKEWDQVEIQIMRTWKWQHSLYWEVKIDEDVLDDVLKNYNENARGIDLVIDENHEPNHKALWWIKDLQKKWKDALFATIELTKMWADLISQWAYKYFSPEIIFNKKDEETWKIIKNLLVGWAFTNRPFFKAMQSLMASEENTQVEEDINKSILFFNTNTSMKTILDLLALFAEGKFSKEDRELLLAKFSELSDDDKTEEMKAAVKEATEEKQPEEKVEEKKDFSETKVKVEWKEISISFSELEELRANAAKAKDLLEEKRKGEFKEKVTNLTFSEKNPKSVVLPKSVDEITDFAFSLSDEQATKFFSIIEKLQVVNSWEFGHDKDNNQQYSEEVVNFYIEKMGMTREDAEKAAIDAKKM